MYNIWLFVKSRWAKMGLRVTYTGRQLNNSRNDSMSFYTRTPVIRPLKGNENQF